MELDWRDRYVQQGQGVQKHRSLHPYPADPEERKKEEERERGEEE